MSENKLRDEIRQLISKNRTEKAIERLSSVQFSKIDKELIILNSKYNRVQTDLRMNVIDRAEAERQINSINVALLELSDRIDKGDTDIGTILANRVKQGGGAKKWWPLLLLPLVALGAYFIISGGSSDDSASGGKVPTVDCNTGTAKERACDDGNPCTVDDVETVLLEDEDKVCEPCKGIPIDCNSIGETEVRDCDDNDTHTVNDRETILKCDGSVCKPCQGTPTDCNNGETRERACDDGNPCTINDTETFLVSDQSICVPCTGATIDCSSRRTVTVACNDNNPDTENDQKTVLACDNHIICEPCRGTAIVRPTTMKFRFTLRNLRVIKDGDGVFDGAGDFTWDIKVNGTTIEQTNREHGMDDGDVHTFNTTREFELPLNASAEFNFNAMIIENDSGGTGDDDVVRLNRRYTGNQLMGVGVGAPVGSSTITLTGDDGGDPKVSVSFSLIRIQ